LIFSCSDMMYVLRLLVDFLIFFSANVSSILQATYVFKLIIAGI